METRSIVVHTAGNTDILNITPDIQDLIRTEAIIDGILFLSVLGSTAGLTTMEYEPGLMGDLKLTFEALLLHRENYAHNATWADDNAHSHLRSAFLKTNFFVSVTKGVPDLGTWQQIVLIDFDTRHRERTIVVKIMR
ncbi:MAG: secondary thiamine-phosphate synthase enzyme YjbQ [Candidatus Omnitrophota bacterium]|nr:secondary thiamine-phosphate synthase enzyme YjbQ [Candidatus Omnitrophota bacterium]